MIAAAKVASAAMAATYEGWEPGNVVLDKPRQALHPAAVALNVLISEFEDFLAENVRNRGKRLELHLHEERKLTPYEDLFLAAARRRFHNDGDLEFEESCVVAGSEDEGDYILCWKWIPNEEVEFPHRYKANIYYRDIGGVLNHIETDEVIALDQGAAERVFLGRHWSERLTASRCEPHLEWLELDLEDFSVVVTPIGEDSVPSDFTVQQHQIEDVRRSMEVLFPPEGYTIEIKGEIWYINKYRCACKDEWDATMSSATAISRCVRCNKETEPYESKVEVTETQSEDS
jgi:hypothetical protein